MATISWAVAARLDLLQIQELTEPYSPSFFPRLLSQISSTVGRLADFPAMGRKVPDFGMDEVRELIVGRYRVIYLLTDDAVSILHVIDGRRDFRLALNPRSPN